MTEKKIEYEEWIEKAEKDLHAAEINLKQSLYEVSAFLSQQAAEKALKAAYILKYKRLWKIHDLEQLGEKVDAPEGIIKICKELTQHYILTRYPDEEEYAKEDAEAALKQAKEVIEWSKNRLKKLMENSKQKK